MPNHCKHGHLHHCPACELEAENKRLAGAIEKAITDYHDGRQVEGFIKDLKAAVYWEE